MGERTYLKTTIIKCASCGHANIFNQPYPYHAGFSDQGFLYNDAGNLTLTWSCYDPAFGAIVGGKSPWALTMAEQEKLETALLPAPVGGRWRFSNPARCLACSLPISESIRRMIYYLVYDGSIHTDDLRRHELKLGDYVEHPSMPTQPTPEIELLRAAYTAFNVREIAAALPLMTPDVAWPRAFKGGFVRGPAEVRAYWSEQWSEIDPHVEPLAFHPEAGGAFLVEVQQTVRDLAGNVLADERVAHRFTLENGLIARMEVATLPGVSQKA